MKFTYPLVALTVLAACQDPILIVPPSLSSPSSVAIARGDACITSIDNVDGTTTSTIERCEDGVVGAVAVVANEQSDRLAFANVNRNIPKLADLDPSVPGVTHLDVGRLPVSVGVSPRGNVAYTLNQLDRDISIVDIIETTVLNDRYVVDETPIAMAVNPKAGEVGVVAGSPSKLYLFGSAENCDSDPCDVEISTAPPIELELDGTATDLVFHPDGTSLYVAYRDRDQLDQIAFAVGEDATQCADPSQSEPCVLGRIGLSFECSDGVDNDGDGQADQLDIQCFGPFGSESGIGGRDANGPCSDGMDNDGDNLTDRDDPDCLRGGSTEDSGVEAPVTACNDGNDNDNDGLSDLADPDCFGPYGSSESTILRRGVDKLAIDQVGTFIYAIDRANSQVLVIDARRGSIVDVPASTEPKFDRFVTTLGVAVSSSPLSITSSLTRTEVGKDVYRYDYGAWVGADNGFIQYVDAVRVYCELDAVSSIDDFIKSELSSEEIQCLALPEFPLGPTVANGECDYVAACDQCIADGGEDCDCSERLENDTVCRKFVNGATKQIVNPRFALADINGSAGRAVGNRECEQPDEIINAMEDFARNNSRSPQQFKCDSPLMPQPLSTFALGADFEPRESASYSRATINQRSLLRYEVEDTDEPTLDVRIGSFDQAVVNEGWTVTYEGVITTKTDGILDVDTIGDDVIVRASGNACRNGIELGDRVSILTETDADLGGTLTYELVDVTASSYQLAVIDEDGFATRVPVREDFETAITFEVRPVDFWIVVGDETGIQSQTESSFSECVPTYSPLDGRTPNGRVRTGDVYQGTYQQFWLWPGFAPEEIKPVRDLSFTYATERNFESLRFESEGRYPAQVLFAPVLKSDGDSVRNLLIAPDPDLNFIFVRDLNSDRTTLSSILR